MSKNGRKSDEIWYTRSVFFVADVEKALHHYQGLLGFERAWDYQDDAKTTVAQITRGSGCEIILCEDSARAGMSRVFISLETQELVALRAEIKAKDIAVKESWWGYPVIEIQDCDGNEMLFPVEEQN